MASRDTSCKRFADNFNLSPEESTVKTQKSFKAQNDLNVTTTNIRERLSQITEFNDEDWANSRKTPNQMK